MPNSRSLFANRSAFARGIKEKIKDLQSRFHNSPLGYGGHGFPT